MGAGEARSSSRHPAQECVETFPLVLLLLLVAAALMTSFLSASAAPRDSQPGPPPVTPDAATAARLFPGVAGPLSITRREGTPPLWQAETPGRPAGVIASTWEIAQSVGYSGQPIDILVGVTPDARISGAELKRHNEPILTLGISTADIARYVGGFAGYDLTAPRVDAFKDSARLPPIIAGATVSTGVIRDAILRTARTAAIGQGYVRPAGGVIDRVTFVERAWPGLVADGSVTHLAVSLDEARRRFGDVGDPLPEAGMPFIDAWIAVLDPPSIGRSLLGHAIYSNVVANVGPGDAAILVAGTGVHSHRGTEYLATGLFDRLELIQGERTIKLRKSDYLRIDKLAIAGAPQFKEISVFRIPASTGFIASDPFRLEISAARDRKDGTESSLRAAVRYALPTTYLSAAATADEHQPLWIAAWQRKPLIIAAVAVMIAWVAGAFFVQEFFVSRPALWLYGRLAFLAVTLVFLGWIAKGQLSVIQVVAFLHSLLNGFHWETFLIEPVIFMLWAFVALGLLFWGRGVYCGWLCPFGALQELLNEAAKRLGVRQIEVPFALQERLWAIKYTLFVAILALSFYSMDRVIVVAEVEPFKTAISMRFLREWPFVAFALALLAAGLFIERFYCRYVCPLGAALAIPAKLKLFDWLHRRPQCGRECRFCETQCTVGAIDTLGRINPNECILCLRCQVIMNDEAQCVVLKRRASRRPESNPST